MEHLTRAVQDAISQRNWYSALGLSLVLPDICGFLEDPSAGSQQRYVAWCVRFLIPRYTVTFGAVLGPHTFLGGEDCYALRCAFLHEGTDEIVRQRARKAIDSFTFFDPPPDGRVIHCNSMNGRLQLQVDIFCRDICSGVDEWRVSVAAGHPDIEQRVAELLEVKESSQGVHF